MRLHSHKSKTRGCWEHAESQFVVMYMQDKTITSSSEMINNEKTIMISNKHLHQNKQDIKTQTHIWAWDQCDTRKTNLFLFLPEPYAGCIPTG